MYAYHCSLQMVKSMNTLFLEQLFTFRYSLSFIYSHGHCNIPSGSIKTGSFLTSRGYYQVFKMDPALRSLLLQRRNSDVPQWQQQRRGERTASFLHWGYLAAVPLELGSAANGAAVKQRGKREQRRQHSSPKYLHCVVTDPLYSHFVNTMASETWWCAQDKSFDHEQKMKQV